MLFVRGAAGHTMVRFNFNRGTDTIRCHFTADQSEVIIQRDTPAHFAAGISAFDAKILQLCGAPQLMSDVPELH